MDQRFKHEQACGRRDRSSSAALAEGLLADTETRVIHGQPASEWTTPGSCSAEECGDDGSGQPTR